MDHTRPPRWLRVQQRLTEYVTLRLLIGLVVCVACLWVFAKLIDEVIIEQEFVQLDNAVARELHAVALPGTTSLFLLISEMGAQVLLVIGAGVAIYFALRRRWLRLTVWIAALLGGEALNALLKQWIARPRPTFA